MNTDTNNLILRLPKGYSNDMKKNNGEQHQNRKKITTQNKTKKVSDECINWVKNINKCLENCETFTLFVESQNQKEKQDNKTYEYKSHY